MLFDHEGHILLPPHRLEQMAAGDQFLLINFFLMRGTPVAFTTYLDYAGFLDDVSSRIGVHPNNLFLRGSCHLGYSFAPKPGVWRLMDQVKVSDLDLVIVDVDYFEKLNEELVRHDADNEAYYIQHDTKRYRSRLQDRRFNLCRDDNMPANTCLHHRDTMQRVPTTKYCGKKRALSAFVFRTWMDARSRYQFDLDDLISGIASGELVSAPIPAAPAVAGAAAPVAAASSTPQPGSAVQAPPAH